MIGLLSILAATVAESLAFYCAAEMFANGYDIERTGAFAPTAFTFAIVALVGFALPRLAAELALSRRNSIIAIGVISYVVLYGAMRIEFGHDLMLWNWSWVGDFLSNAEETSKDAAPAIFGSALLILCFARGAWRGGDDLELETIPASLGIWLVLVLILVVFNAGSDRAALIGRGAAAFFSFAIIAMALSQSALSGTTIGRARAGSVTGVLLLGTVAATLVGLLVFGVVVGVAGDEIGSVIYTVVDAVAYVILTPIAIVLAWFFHLIIPEGAMSQLVDNSGLNPGNADQNAVDEMQSNDPAWQRLLRFAVRLGLLGIVAAVVIGLLIVVIRLKRRGATLRESEAVHSSAGSLGADLAAGLRSLFSRRDGSGGHVERDGIYRLYAAVLDDAEGRGIGRPASRTPEEHAPVLAATYRAGVTDEITVAFEHARYAGRETDAASVAELQRRWEQSRLVQEP